MQPGEVLKKEIVQATKYRQKNNLVVKAARADKKPSGNKCVCCGKDRKQNYARCPTCVAAEIPVPVGR